MLKILYIDSTFNKRLSITVANIHKGEGSSDTLPRRAGVFN